MKNIKLLLVSMLAAVFSGCMDHHDDPTNYTYGNPAVGEANTTIADLKTKYAGIVSSNKAEEVQEDLVISGVIVGDDESGNIYKNLYVNDGSGTLVVGINATGLYAFLPVGQKIAINCKGLYVGGYGSMAPLGALYQDRPHAGIHMEGPCQSHRPTRPILPRTGSYGNRRSLAFFGQ